MHLAAERKTQPHGTVRNGAVEAGHCPRHAKAYGADMGVGRCSEFGGAGAKYLGLRRELDVHLESADHLVILYELHLLFLP